jgi:hypothetical protein
MLMFWGCDSVFVPCLTTLFYFFFFFPPVSSRSVMVRSTANGDIYNGEWVDDKKQGHGIFTSVPFFKHLAIENKVIVVSCSRPPC